MGIDIRNRNEWQWHYNQDNDNYHSDDDDDDDDDDDVKEKHWVYQQGSWYMYIVVFVGRTNCINVLIYLWILTCYAVNTGKLKINIRGCYSLV